MDRRRMDRRTGPASWIGAYVEWTDAGEGVFGTGPLARSSAAGLQVEASEEFAAAYLDWMDAGAPGRRTAAGAGLADTASGLDAFREALMVALHTESDCIRFLRRILDAGDASAHTVSLASEALEHAERLLEHERRAWRTLPALGFVELPEAAAVRRAEFERNWPSALADVAADVQALAGKVMALQAH